MSTVDERADLIYAWLHQRLGQQFTMPQLCQALGLQPGTKTTAAIRRARDIATQAGLHFPPAVPQNGYTYTVTSLPGDALDPAIQMSRIEAGVRARADVGYEFMRRHRRQIPADLRPVVDAALQVQQTTRRALAEAQRAMDDMTIAIVKVRRQQRQG